MAYTTIITASNGFKLRPLIESDFNFWMECWKDFPQGVQTYEMRLRRFSLAIIFNEKEHHTEAVIQAGDVGTTSKKSIIWTTVMENSDQVPVALGVRIFEEPHVLFAKFGMVHPSHRGNKYWNAHQVMLLALAERLQITSGFGYQLVESPSQNAANHMREAFSNSGADTSGTLTSKILRYPDGEIDFITSEDAMTKNVFTIAQFRTFKANNSDWAGVTWAYS